MAQIDLARATVVIRDGFTKSGTLGAAGTTNDTSLTISGFTAAIPNGARLQIAGDSTYYSVVSSTGGATPTAVTITPALKADASSGAAVTVGPNFITIVMAEGNLTFEEKKKYEYVRNKRLISFVKTGDEEPTDVSIDAIWEYLSSVTGESPTIEEALKQSGGASAWVTSGADPCEPYCVDIEVTYSPPCTDTNKQERITLKEFRFESLNHNLKDGMLNTKGMCKITSPVVERF